MPRVRKLKITTWVICGVNLGRQSGAAFCLHCTSSSAGCRSSRAVTSRRPESWLLHTCSFIKAEVLVHDVPHGWLARPSLSAILCPLVRCVSCMKAVRWENTHRRGHLVVIVIWQGQSAGMTGSMCSNDRIQSLADCSSMSRIIECFCHILTFVFPPMCYTTISLER